MRNQTVVNKKQSSHSMDRSEESKVLYTSESNLEPGVIAKPMKKKRKGTPEFLSKKDETSSNYELSNYQESADFLSRNGYTSRSNLDDMSTPT